MVVGAPDGTGGRDRSTGASGEAMRAERLQRAAAGRCTGPMLRFARDEEVFEDPELAAAETLLEGVRSVSLASRTRDGRTAQSLAIGVR